MTLDRENIKDLHDFVPASGAVDGKMLEAMTGLDVRDLAAEQIIKHGPGRWDAGYVRGPEFPNLPTVEPETIGEEIDRLALEKADYQNNRDRQNRE